MMKSYAPRFTTRVFIYRYDGRDVPYCFKVVSGPSAETRAWLDVKLERAFGDDGEYRLEIDDNNPERELGNWGPKLPTDAFVVVGPSDDFDLSPAGSYHFSGRLEIEELPF